MADSLAQSDTSRTIAVSQMPRNLRGAAVNTSLSVCLRADVARAIGGLIWAGVLIAGLLAGEALADAYLNEGIIALIVIGALVGLIVLIASSLRRDFMRAQRRRARLAEACGLRARDLL